MLFVLDGIDATGKSTLCNNLSAKFDAHFFPEFSTTFIGQGIVQIIAKNRFFRLTNDGSTTLSELLCILADSVYQYEQATRLSHTHIFMDRGIISAIAYQVARMEAKQILQSEFDNFACNVVPVLTAQLPIVGSAKHINLEVSPEALQRRIVERGETELTPKDVKLMMDIQEYMKDLGGHLGAVQISTSSMELEEVCDQISAIVQTYS